MSDKQQESGQTSVGARDLRKRAEEQVRAIESVSLSSHPPEAIRQMFHELRVHQIELAMQNEELRAAQAEIEASRARYFDLYDLAPVGYTTISEKGLILEANLTAATLLGVNRGALVNQFLTRYILKEDQDVYYLHRKKLFETGEPQRCDLRLVKPDGSVFWAYLDAIAAPGPDGAPVCRLVLSDITAQKLAEAEKEILQAQLAQAQKMESVGRLAGGVAHDFNNMLQVILANAELALNESTPGSPVHESLCEIRHSAERSADLTRKLLAFARKQAIAPKVLDLNETVASMLKMLRRLIGENIALIWQPGTDLWTVNMDSSQVDQLLANLCINARAAIANVGTITLSTDNIAFDEEYCSNHAGFAPGEYVRLTVSDNGYGMDAETLDHIFEPFFTTKGVGEGIGLGLATVYGAVKQNNGFINACSEPGQGTTFTIYLPRHVAKTDQMRTHSAAEPDTHGHKTILLVEDEPLVLKLTTRLLERQGYTVLAAVTPGEAIRLAKEYSREIHLLLTDVMMPVMNGHEVARNVQVIYPDIKRVFMSGYTADIIASQGVLDKGVHFIQKPFSSKNLATTIKEALGAAQEE